MVSVPGRESGRTFKSGYGDVGNMTRPPDDRFSWLAGVLRRSWAGYREYSFLINGVIGVLALLVTLLAFYSPSTLDTMGRLVGEVAASDVTHTFLLLGLIVLTYMTSGADGTTAVTDGGEEDAILNILLLILFAFFGATLGSAFGDEWVLPGILVGMFVFLQFFADS